MGRWVQEAIASRLKPGRKETHGRTDVRRAQAQGRCAPRAHACLPSRRKPTARRSPAPGLRASPDTRTRRIRARPTQAMDRPATPSRMRPCGRGARALRTWSTGVARDARKRRHKPRARASARGYAGATKTTRHARICALAARLAHARGPQTGKRAHARPMVAHGTAAKPQGHAARMRRDTKGSTCVREAHARMPGKAIAKSAIAPCAQDLPVTV